MFRPNDPDPGAILCDCRLGRRRDLKADRLNEFGGVTDGSFKHIRYDEGSEREPAQAGPPLIYRLRNRAASIHRRENDHTQLPDRREQFGRSTDSLAIVARTPCRLGVGAVPDQVHSDARRGTEDRICLNQESLDCSGLCRSRLSYIRARIRARQRRPKVADCSGSPPQAPGAVERLPNLHGEALK
jgi:hypothetical protein